jgi:sugar phosphate isomerase/epimerase
MKSLSRRKFLAQGSFAAAAVTATTLFPRHASAFPLKNAPGLQLYSVGDPLKKDVNGTLKKVRAIGYMEVETAGFGNLTAKQFRQALDAAGLRCHSSHLDLNTGDLDLMFDNAHTVGAHYAVSAVLLPEGARANKDLFKMNADDYKKVAANANRIARKAKQAGLQYAYHNHNFEFIDLGNGKIGYDILLKETDPELVQFELDCGWMVSAGRNPIDYFKRYPNRYKMIHVKDFVPHTQERPMVNMEMNGTELGRGAIDYKPLLAAAKSIGVEYYYVEQEPPFVGMTPIQAVKADFDYLRAL